MIEQRAVAACVEYYALRKEIDALTEQIGKETSMCNAFYHDDLDSPLRNFYKARIEIRQFGKTDAAIFGDFKDFHQWTEDDLKEECPHCYEVHKAIEARRAKRRRLAAVKQKIMNIGKKGANK